MVVSSKQYFSGLVPFKLGELPYDVLRSLVIKDGLLFFYDDIDYSVLDFENKEELVEFIRRRENEKQKESIQTCS